MGKRLIYMLESAPKRRLRCRPFLTTQLNWRSFHPPSITEFHELLKTKFADSVDKADRMLLSKLIQAEERADWEARALLSHKLGAAILLEALETGRLFHAKGNHLRIAPGEVVEAQPVWRETPEGKWLPDFEAGGTDAEPGSMRWLSMNPPLYLDLSSHKNRLGRLRTPWPDELTAAWLDTEPMDIAGVAAFRLRLLKRHAEADIPDIPVAMPPPAVATKTFPRLTVWQSNGGRDAPEAGVFGNPAKLLMVRLAFVYGTRAIPEDHPDETVHYQDGAQVVAVKRDASVESAWVAQLTEAGFRRGAGEPEEGMLFSLDADAYKLVGASWHFVCTALFPQWRTEGWEIRLPTSINLQAVDQDCIETTLTPDGKEGYAYSVNARAGENHYPLLPALVAHLNAHKREGRAKTIESLRAQALWWCPKATVKDRERILLLSGNDLADIATSVYELEEPRALRKNVVHFDRWRAGEVATDLRLESNGLFSMEPLRRYWETRADRIELSPPPDLPTSAEILRPYQKDGLAWLEFLRESGTHGILADDMGLGKTLQTLVYLDYEKARGHLTLPALIVGPTSVLSNWEREARTRTPMLRVRLHHGQNREPLSAAILAQTDVVITSYGLLQQEAQEWTAFEWAYLILDEAQNIKNRQARRTQAARAIRAARRLCLSGTPMENHLGEMWSLFNFLMPGFLGGYPTFENRFRKPIENAGDPLDARQRSAALARRIRPFILRRTKEQVARDLPERIETTHFLPLDPDQKTVYERHRREMLDSVREHIREHGLEKSRIYLLEALLRLRQICCDPRLIGEEGGDAMGQSAKLERLLEMLEELREEGHRTLVFSQFVSMLELIAEACRERGWKFLTFTGATTDRQQIVDAFNEGDCPILLISLKAGGAGLNLTGADTVIHFDPWWNPATEQQATDRAHRIGQTRPVFIHRLIAEDTIEERILTLHAKKRAMVEDLLAGLPTDHIQLDESILEAFD